jgi:hypothetical protein
MWETQHYGRLAGVWMTWTLSGKFASWQRCVLQPMLAARERAQARENEKMSLQKCDAWMGPGRPLLGFADSQANRGFRWAPLPTLLSQLEWCLALQMEMETREN